MAERFWTPSRSYDFQLIIKDKDYTPDLQRVSILTSLLTPYQTIMLDIFIDANDMILDKIYGQDKLKLRIRLLGQGELPLEEIDFELMLLNIDYDILMKATDEQKTMKDRSAVQLVTVCRKPFKTMSSIVNSISFAATASQVAGTLISGLNTSPKQIIDQAGISTEKIDQILVPPLTFYKAIHYLDEQFGIYNKSLMGFGCLYDNTIYIKNLSSKPKKAQTFTINYLATDTPNMKEIQQGVDGKTFYTWTAIDTSYKGNTVYSYLAPYNRYVVKPSDLLYKNIDIDLGTEAKNFGIVSKDTKIYYDRDTISTRRKSVHVDHTGYEDSNNFISYPDLSDLTTIRMELTSKNITLLNFMNVGESVKFNTKVQDYTQLSGKYVLKSSQLRFERIKEWEAYSLISLIRTNKAAN